MGSAYRAVSDPSVHFAYAVNPFMVGNLADTPFDGQSAILQRGRRGRGCHYVGDGAFVRRRGPAGLPRVRRPQAAVPRARAVGGARRAARARCAPVGAALAGGHRRPTSYVQTAVIADLPFPRRPRPAPAAWWPGR